MELTQTIGVIITIVVSVISLVLSILAFIQQKPKLRCEIIKAYYGPAQLKEYYEYLLPQEGEDQNIEFFYSDDGNLYGSGGAIPYNSTGINLPFKINSYEAILPTFVFHNIPEKFHGKKCGNLIIKTTAGKLKKRIKLTPYDINTVKDWNEVEKFLKSEVK